MKIKFKGFLTLFMAFVVQIVFAQEKTISGTVSDSSGSLPGVSVLIKGTNKGKETDFYGNYSIRAKAGDILVFSYLGYKTVEMTVGASNTINVTLEEGGEVLGEVLVTAQGIKSNPRALSYSVEIVGGESVQNSRETNMVSGLSAKAAGVQVTSSSGSVGASANIRIRGNTSITRSNSPLFVVDGVPIDNSSFSEDPTQSFNNSSTGGTDFSNRAVDINSNDIESISILKGIAAQTLYGLRAANGVVLITTKKGRSGKTRVTYSSEVGWSQFNKMPALQSVYSQGRHNPNGTGFQYRGPSTFEGDSWGPKISDLEHDSSEESSFHSQGGLVPKGTAKGTSTDAKSYNPLDFYKTGIVYNNNLSVSGGNSAASYRFSIGRLVQEGISPNEKFERKTFRLDLKADIIDKLVLDASAQYTNSGGNRVQRGSNLSGVMLGTLRTSPSFDNGNGKVGQDAADSPDSYFYSIDGAELPGHRSYRGVIPSGSHFKAIYNNPYFTVARNKNTDDVNRIIGKVGLNYDINDWLSVKSTASVDTYTDTRKIGFDISDASFGEGRVINDVITNQDVNWNLIFSMNKELDGDLNLSASVGYDGYFTKNNRNTIIGDGMTIPGFFNTKNTRTTQAFEGTSKKKLIGAFATATLSYENMLYLTPSFRNDWTSTLSADNNTFQSYSIGASFVFSELLDNDFINYGKFRSSWGATGNDAPVYVTTTNFIDSSVGGDGFILPTTFPAYDSTSFERSSRAGNPNLTPERTTEIELGLELSMMDSRLKFDYTYYNKKTKDQIIFVDRAPSSGFVDGFENSGVIANYGHEVNISGTPIKTDDFSWDIGINWTTYENVVEELAEGVENISLNGFSGSSSRAVAGESYGAIFGTRFSRNDAGEILIGSDGYPIQDGTSGMVGDPIPDWIAGISNIFKYKGIELSVLIDIRKGGDVWCGTCGIINYFGTSEATLIRDKSTVFQGVVQSTNLPNNQLVPYSDPTVSENNNYWRRYGFGGLTEMSVFDSSWVRLREVTISYSIPQKLLENTFIDGISIAAYGRNLWLSTDYPGIDPETNLTGNTNGIGLDYFNQPNTKSYGINVKLNF